MKVSTDMNKNYIIEPQKKIPVICKADVCVVGGSSTGVFAAVRAARLGAKVILIEKQNCFGGVATSGLVNVWHTYFDTSQKKQIISGLSEEITDRMELLNDGYRDKSGSHCFNPNELKIELDCMLKESGVKFYLHTYYSGIICEESKIKAVYVENKDGRGAISADFFIDATGDGDLARDLGIKSYKNANIQPPSACFLLQGDTEGIDVSKMIRKYGKEFCIEEDWGWSNNVPRCDSISMRADTHIFGLICNNAEDLTKAEVEGRRKMRAVVSMLNKYGRENEKYNIVSSCSYIGIRETVHYKTKYQAKEISLLTGERYDDAILNGTYGVDIHHSDKGITFKDFDGTYHTEYPDGSCKRGSWREEMNIPSCTPIPTYYQLPFRCLVGEKYENFIAAGRMLNADTGAFGALRVMVNLNQTGEAAGVGAYLCIDQNKTIQSINGVDVAKTLSKGGSANLL